MSSSNTIVLVVEDEPLVRMDIADRLQDEGFTVVEASNADEALRILDSGADIRIVFTDVDMPGSMDGLKLAAAVRDRWPPIAIVVTSGHRKVELSDMPTNALFFPKPYAPDRLVASFRQMVSE